MSQDKYVFSTQKIVHYRFPTHTNDLVMDRADGTTSEVFFSIMEPGESPPLHVHHDTEQIFHVLEGMGTLYIGKEEKPFAVKPGDVVRIPPHTLHRIQCESKEAIRYLTVDCFIGGRPKEEPTWESHVRTICEQNGWNFEKVKKP